MAIFMAEGQGDELQTFPHPSMVHTAALTADGRQLVTAGHDGKTRVLDMLTFEAHAEGTLREAFGVPDGTPGRAQTTQIGLFPPGSGATADAYPAEHITLKIVSP